MKYFIYLSESGSIGKVDTNDLEHLHEKHTLSFIDPSPAFRHASARGNLDILKWLHLDVLKWLHNRSDDNSVFRYASANVDLDSFRLASEHGHLDVLKWLYETFEMTREDARAEDNFAFRHASANGHLDVLKWLHETFNLTAEDARSAGNSAFRMADENGYLDVCKWINETFEIIHHDDWEDNDSAWGFEKTLDFVLDPLICFFENAKHFIKVFVLSALYALLLFSVPVVILAFAFGIFYCGHYIYMFFPSPRSFISIFLLLALLLVPAWGAGNYLMKKDDYL